MQQEQLRHQYLEALGISSWLPCTQLPGAAKSPAWVDDFRYPAPDIPFQSERASDARAELGLATPNVPSTPGTPKAAVASPSSAATQQQGMSQARAALGLSEDPPTKTAPVSDAGSEPVAEERAETVENESPPVFKLAFQRIGKTLVVDSLPPQGGGFSEHYQQLAKAITASLGEIGEAGAAFMLPWPMFASKTLDQGYAQALVAVQHKLNKEIQANPTEKVLLFGESAAQFVMERKESLEEIKGIAFTVRNGVKAVASYSLTEAMQLPGIKKQIWCDLQPLVQQSSG